MYFRKAHKYTGNVEEFTEWARDQQLIIDPRNKEIFKLYTPHRSLWFEFHCFKERVYQTYTPSIIDLNTGGIIPGSEIAGAGYDLDENVMYILCTPHQVDKKRFALNDASEPGDFRLFKNPIEDFDFTKQREPTYAMVLQTLLTVAQMTRYLQTEFVDAERRTFVERKRMRRGKLIEELSEFQVIYRKQPHKYDPKNPDADVDWQHRWHVRGHWRKVKDIGYDIDGNEMKGWTWVKAHVKGPEDKPLVERTRIIKDSLPPQYKRA
jgi:hypothetical protein